MRRHTSNCTSISRTGQLHALRQQAKQGGSGTTCSQAGNTTDSGKPHFDGCVGTVKISPHQWGKWYILLAIAFVMNGWSFCTVESSHFKNFMNHVWPNFALPSDAATPSHYQQYTAESFRFKVA